VNSGEYKVMGLAPYGRPVYEKLIREHLIDLKDDGSFKLDMRYFGYGCGLRMVNSRFEKLFGGPARTPESPLTQREMDLAASVQKVTEDVILRIVRHAHSLTRSENLCLAGGVALNCVGNGRIVREGPFKRVWIQPAAGDAGGALGAAMSVWYRYMGSKRPAGGGRDAQSGSLLGPSYDDNSIEEYLRADNIPYRKLGEKDFAAVVADLIAAGNVIGWFQGRMEFGPRALGARSIIGDSRDPAMQSRMNLKIKYRESFRPFAPTVLAGKASEWFDIEGESPYMLVVASVNRDKHVELQDHQRSLSGMEALKVRRSVIPAVTHVDYSARVQTVTRQDNPRYYDTIEAFGRKTGCPVVINTSFNVRGEPLVCSPQDAYRCFMRTDMDYLVMGSFLLDKKEQPALSDDVSWKKEFALD